MKTTEVILEMLVAGALATGSLLLLFWSVRPAEVERSLATIAARVAAHVAGPVGAVLLGAAAYSAGILSEYVARAFFEPWLNGTKRRRLQKLVDDYKSKLEVSPILREFGREETPQIDDRGAKEKVGQMRFEIRRLSSEHARDVESKVNRMRLVRVLFFVEIFCILSTLFWLWRRWSPALLLLCLFLAAVLFINWKAVLYRFDRYCLTIERAYKGLVLDAPDQTETQS